MWSILSESIHTPICTMNNALVLALEREKANETGDYDALIVDDGTATAALLDAPVFAGEADEPDPAARLDQAEAESTIDQALMVQSSPGTCNSIPFTIYF